MGMKANEHPLTYGYEDGFWERETAMILLVSGATQTMKRYRDHPALGNLLVPRAGNDPAAFAGKTWGADNGAFGGFDEGAFCRMLDRIAGLSPLWVAAPDVVSDALATARLYAEWEPRIRSHDLPVAYVAQDGQENFEPPWERMDACFIGGSTAWKVGESAFRIAREAKARGNGSIWAE